MANPALTFISDEVSQDLAAVARFTREFGLGGFELRSLNGRAFQELTRADIAAVRRCVRDEGWRIVGCASPVFKCPLDDAGAVGRHREIFRRSLEIAHELDCDLVRVFTFLREARADLTAWDRMQAELLGLLALARDSGVRVAVENEAACLVATNTELLRLGSALPDPRLGWVWDPCNLLYLPEPPAADEPGFAALLPRIFHLHVKDATRQSGPAGASPASSVPVGVGDVGWRHLLRTIANSRYAGWLSLETHWRETALAGSALHQPAGYAFSEGGESASRVCFHNLRALWPINRAAALRSLP